MVFYHTFYPQITFYPQTVEYLLYDISQYTQRRVCPKFLFPLCIGAPLTTRPSPLQPLLEVAAAAAAAAPTAAASKQQ